MTRRKILNFCYVPQHGFGYYWNGFEPVKRVGFYTLPNSSRTGLKIRQSPSTNRVKTRGDAGFRAPLPSWLIRWILKNGSSPKAPSSSRNTHRHPHLSRHPHLVHLFGCTRRALPLPPRVATPRRPYCSTLDHATRIRSNPPLVAALVFIFVVVLLLKLSKKPVVANELAASNKKLKTTKISNYSIEAEKNAGSRKNQKAVVAIFKLIPAKTKQNKVVAKRILMLPAKKIAGWSKISRRPHQNFWSQQKNCEKKLMYSHPWKSLVPAKMLNGSSKNNSWLK